MPPPTIKPYKGRLVVGFISPTAQRVAGEYMQPPPDIVVATWLMVTLMRTSQLTSLSQKRQPVLAGIGDQRGALLAAACDYGITQPPRLPSPSLTEMPHKATMWED